jgi:hypothetical protein
MDEELKPAEKVMLAALLSGHRIAKRFQEATGLCLTTEDIRAIAISQVIEYNRRK